MHPTRFATGLVLASIALLLAGCGSGGSSASGGAGAAAGDLGTRAMPDGTVTVTALGALTAGMPARWRITTAGMTGIVAVEALLGTDHADARPLAVSADGDAWLATGTLPAPLPDACRILVRITDASGGIQESGAGDFALVVR